MAKKIINELLEQLTAIAIVLAFMALIGFAGWITEPASGDVFGRITSAVSGGK